MRFAYSNYAVLHAKEQPQLKYSVLMSVYRMDQPHYFKQAVNSMLQQTILPDEIILVCDGPLTAELEAAIQEYKSEITVIRLNDNKGLGVALNIGIQHCRNELVARMDCDDISLPDRCEKELKAFEKNDQLAIISGTIEEFYRTDDQFRKKRTLPLEHDKIVQFSKKRCPFNHPAVMYKKSAVIAAGGYREDYHRFEDYDLWVRMLKNHAVSQNLSDVLLSMRVSDALYMRRGGREYTKALLRFHNHLRKSGWISTYIFVTCAIPHAMVCILPNSVRKMIYKLLRKQ